MSKIKTRLMLLVMCVGFSTGSYALTIVSFYCVTPQYSKYVNWQADFDRYCVYYWDDTHAYGEKDGKVAIYDIPQNKQITPFIYDYDPVIRYGYGVTYWQNGEDSGFTIRRDGQWGLLDKTGKEIFLSEDFSHIYSFNDGVAVVTAKAITNTVNDASDSNSVSNNKPIPSPISDSTQNPKQGVIDSTGKLIIPMAFDSIDTFNYGYAVVSKNKKYGVIDKQGHLVVPYQYDAIKPFGKNGLTAVLDSEQAKGKFALMDNKGQLRSDFIYDGVTMTDEAVTMVYQKKEGTWLWGLVDKTGELVAPIQYENKDSFTRGYLRAYDSYDNKYGYFDGNGQITVPFIYDYLGRVQKDYWGQDDGDFIFVTQKIEGKDTESYIDTHNQTANPHDVLYSYDTD